MNPKTLLLVAVALPAAQLVAHGQVRVTPGQGTRPVQECTAQSGLRFPYASGTGTAVDPWLICSVAQFRNIELNSGFFILGTDLDFTGEAYAPFPLNDSILDGRGHTLRNLSVDGVASMALDSGLFTIVLNSTVRNLRLEDFTVRGWERVGSLAGYSWASTVHNVVSCGATVSAASSGFVMAGGLTGRASGEMLGCRFEGSVGIDPAFVPSAASRGWFGGLVGYAREARLEQNRTDGCVTGFESVGGVAGYAAFTIFSRQGSNMDVRGRFVPGRPANVGGLVGYLRDESGPFPPTRIVDSYSKGEVHCMEDAEDIEPNCGGLVGHIYNFNTGIDLLHGFATGAMTNGSTASDPSYAVGGLVGKLETDGGAWFFVEGNYFDLLTTGQTEDVGTFYFEHFDLGIGIKTPVFQDEPFLVANGYDTLTIWEIADPYPELRD